MFCFQLHENSSGKKTQFPLYPEARFDGHTRNLSGFLALCSHSLVTQRSERRCLLELPHPFGDLSLSHHARFPPLLIIPLMQSAHNPLLKLHALQAPGQRSRNNASPVCAHLLPFPFHLGSCCVVKMINIQPSEGKSD